jgi:putative two-component system response regulator
MMNIQRRIEELYEPGGCIPMFRNLPDLTQQELLEHVILTAHIAEIAEWDNHSHLERIRRYTYILAMHMEMGQDSATLFSTASLLHDIGKITLPISILKKTANLEPAEYQITEQHTVEGSRLLSGSGSHILQAGETIARSHHERWDGSGYPDGLKGEAIPLTGRIMALADVFDALTTKRSYKKEIQPAAALDLIIDSSGSLFDPKLVSIFVDNFDEIRVVYEMKE